MSRALIEKLRRGREFQLPINGHTYTLRRPTDAEIAAMPDTASLEFVRRFVVGWDLRELDIIPGGGPEPAEFDAELWREWVGDQRELWEPIASALLNAITDHAKSRKESEKN
jgi:hypothetical protein